MSLIVQKFGGSCISNAHDVNNAASIIAREYNSGNSIVVIVSAQGNTTNMLIEKAKDINVKPSKRELDVVMSAGEQLSAAIMSMAVQANGVPCISLLGWQAGIFTGTAYGSARINNIDCTRIKKELAKKNVVIIAGFQGVNKNNDMTTLGRGGSDTTAVAVAAAMGAEKCQVFSKTDGIYTADPEMIKTAVRIDEISYDCMQELSFLGVKVLNPRAVELAKKYGVVIEVLSAFSHSGSTLVKETEKVEKMLISGVTKTSNIAKMTVCSIPDEPGAAFKLFGILAKNNIDVDIILQSSASDGMVDIVFTVEKYCADEAVQLLITEGGYRLEQISANKTVSKVSVVGNGMESHPGVAAAIFEALSESGINILLISSSELRFSVVVSSERADEAVSAIHKRFINLQ